MKKATLLLALILISTIGFSQNKIGGDDPIAGIDIIIKKDPGSRPIVNTGNNALIDEVNKLELEYLNLKAKEVQYGFGNQDLSKLKTKDEVFKEYIEYLNIEIKELSIKIHVEEKKLKKQGDPNANRYDFETGLKMKDNKLEKESKIDKKKQ